MGFLCREEKREEDEEEREWEAHLSSSGVEEEKRVFVLILK